MKRGRSTSGFTIVEVLVFLAVSGALLFASMGVITASQRGTEFNQGANDALQQVNAVISTVANGYYAGNDNVKCTNPSAGGSLVLTEDTVKRGESLECEFIGRAIEFSDTEYFTVYDIAGARKNGAGRDVTSMAQAKPAVIEFTTQKVYYKNGVTFPANGLKNGVGAPVRGVAFLSSLAKASTAGPDLLSSSNQQYDFVQITGSSMKDGVAGLATSYSPNPTSGIKLCLNGGTNDRHATIQIGGDSGRSASTVMTIGGGVCS